MKPRPSPDLRAFAFLRALTALCADHRVELSGIFGVVLEGADEATLTDIAGVTAEGVTYYGAPPVEPPA